MQTDAARRQKVILRGADRSGFWRKDMLRYEIYSVYIHISITQHTVSACLAMEVSVSNVVDEVSSLLIMIDIILSKPTSFLLMKLTSDSLSFDMKKTL